MNAFTLTNLLATRKHSRDLYHEFLRVPSMSAGVYQLTAGATDPQEQHTEDELYSIVQGKALLKVGNEDIPVEPGSLVFVAAHIERRFHTITEDLTVLVFLAPGRRPGMTVAHESWKGGYHGIWRPPAVACLSRASVLALTAG